MTLIEQKAATIGRTRRAAHTLVTDRASLVAWYHGVKRDLPWRKNRDPYRIWVSEVMLQQTTVVAVIPFYEKFMTRFPSLTSLAAASVEDVIEHWAGLGYYSRARNLHRSAQVLAAGGFPETYRELIELPGFGPYTARAVSSLAFDEPTGVLDGNVIRVLSRRYGLKTEWWKPQGRAELQAIADDLATSQFPADVNQAMMELGATVCTPKSPTCLLCPWSRVCVAREMQAIADYPLRRPRREREMWHWSPVVVRRKGTILLVRNDYAPFLKGHWILPGEVSRAQKAPKKFDYKGGVTHHDIFVSVANASRYARTREEKWIPMGDLRREVPASLIRKAIAFGHANGERV